METTTTLKPDKITKTVRCKGCGKRFGGKQRDGYVGYEDEAVCRRCERDFGLSEREEKNNENA